jgi:hypothetical protein
MAFDSIEPLDPAGIFLRSFSSGKEGAQQAPPSSGSNWQQQKMNMLHYFKLFGKKK